MKDYDTGFDIRPPDFAVNGTQRPHVVFVLEDASTSLFTRISGYVLCGLIGAAVGILIGVRL